MKPAFWPGPEAILSAHGKKEAVHENGSDGLSKRLQV
jgi:hypothetical protein